MDDKGQEEAKEKNKKNRQLKLKLLAHCAGSVH